jgi:hypothetical protein
MSYGEEDTHTHTNVVPLLVEGIRAGLKEQGDGHRLHEKEDTCHMRSRGMATAYMSRRIHVI